MGDKTRKIIGFDNFSGFTDLTPEEINFLSTKILELNDKYN